jgi:uncharacterized protein (DUF427 family)
MDAHQRGRVRVERGQKRIRVYLHGEVVADTRAPLLVWESPHYPAYYIPVADVRAQLTDSGDTDRSPSRGTATILDVTAGGRTAAGAALRYADSPIGELRDAVRLDWDAMDEWLEEDEPVYTHPRDPYSRVDILASSRHVRVELDGVCLAESDGAHILFETGLPPRFYLPLTALRRDLLRPSDTVTHCPYKGSAAYWSVEVNGTVHDDLVWIYRTPLPESQKIAGMACFFNEAVDLIIDGERWERPRTPFS